MNLNPERTDKDAADLARAAQMAKEAATLRGQVLNRIRQRRFRAKKA